MLNSQNKNLQNTLHSSKILNKRLRRVIHLQFSYDKAWNLAEYFETIPKAKDKKGIYHIMPVSFNQSWKKFPEFPQ